MAIAATPAGPRLAWVFRRVSVLAPRPPRLVTSVDHAVLAGTSWDVLAVSTLCVQCVSPLVGDVLELKPSLGERPVLSLGSRWMARQQPCEQRRWTTGASARNSRMPVRLRTEASAGSRRSF